MFDFLRAIKGKALGERESTFTIAKYSCIQCTEDGRTLVVNFDNSKWTVECGGMSHEVLTVSPPGGIELFDKDELLRQIKKMIRGIARGSTVDRLLRQALDGQSTVLMVLPAMGETRFEAYETFEEFLKRRYKATSKSLEAIRFYNSPNRPGVHRALRKFQGRDEPYVVLNLTSESVKYFHYYSNEKDVTVDSLMDTWPEGRTQLGQEAERAIRAMDPKVFDRLRDGLREGVVVVLLPQDKLQRDHLLETVEGVLGQVPGEEPISLDSARVLRIYRGGGKRTQKKA